MSVLSAPIIESINIASFGEVKFGVFGWCSKSAGCSGITFGYNMDEILMNEGTSDFKLTRNARNSLTNLLIVHPIAAFMTFILFLLSVLSHLNKPAHSPKYLLVLVILCLPTFVVTLMALLVDILIFLPHVQWAGWSVAASTILIAISGVVMCGIRRQIVGRIARRKRIQENAEMNNRDNDYFESTNTAMIQEPQDKIEEFATFEVDKLGPQLHEGEQIPLNPRIRNPSIPEDHGYTRTNTLSSDRSQYGGTPSTAGPLGPGSNAMGGNTPAGMIHPQIRKQYSNQTMVSASSTTVPYGPPWDPGLGHPLPDQGYNPPASDQFDVSRGLPPHGRFGPSAGPAYQRGPPPLDAFDYQRGPGYGRDTPPNSFGSYGPSPHGAFPPMEMGLRAPPPRRPMPPPGTTYDDLEFPAGIDGSPMLDERREFDQTLAPVANGNIGMALSNGGYAEEDLHKIMPIDLPEQIDRAVGENGDQHSESYEQPTRRTSWIQHQGAPLRTNELVENMPAELPAPVVRSTPPSRAGSPKSRRASGAYYEDVAPQFDTSHQESTPPVPFPPSLTPGPYSSPLGQHSGPWSPPPIPDDPVEVGQRSPAMSTASGFTSISQRGVNPRWQEEQGNTAAPGRGRGGGVGRKTVGRNSVGLAGNPDFELPSISSRGGRGGGRGRGSFR